MKTLDASNRPPGRRLGPIALLALALGTQAGCGREFFREWANQDASEAIFEKSRDPRFRLDMFSIEPPALARYADPYDPDVPPAPPDDHATEALSPAPQWPENRLITPVEGTAYLDMLEAWKRQRPETGTEAEVNAPATPPAQPRTLLPPTPGGPSPFQAPPIPGTNPPPISPNTIPGGPPPNPAEPGTIPPEARVPKTDLGVRLAAFQETRLPLPVPPERPEAPGPQPPRRDPIPAPPIGMDPDPIDSDLSAPITPRRDLTEGEYRASEALGSEMASILIPKAIEFDEAEAAGLPRNSKPYVLTLEQAFTLALTNSRFYQFQLEQLYIASLAVTLQRFAFQPQFFAGLQPNTGVPQFNGGGAATGAANAAFAPNPISQFIYATRETGNPLSSLTLGEVAGFGKAFSSGARMIAGFANQIVFNFLGQNSRQPTVRSFLPLTLVQPFLRGGGRAVTLEALTLAERQLLYQVRSFAKFRQEFLVSVLVGGTIQNLGSSVASLGFSSAGNIDPTTGFINVLQDLQQVENDRKNIAAFEQLVLVYRELIQGESSGLSQLQLDQVESNLQSARSRLVTDRLTYRNDLDNFKLQMGLPPDVPVIPDRSLTSRFRNVFNAIDEWQRNPRREMTDLPEIAAGVPELEDVIIDGRSVLSVYDEAEGAKNSEDALEPLLLAGERLALERRLDLMNARAALYDTWRQIRVTANALMGTFNVALTNQFLTPTNTNNPFAFLEQAKQFSLVINAELPLVRLAERNNFRQALINYQRQRRSLMQNEDFIKLQIRQDIRNLQSQYLVYRIAKRNLVLQIRQKDQAFETIIAPPAAAAAGAQSSQGAIQTTNLVNFQQSLLNQENTLVSTWQQYQLARLTLYRDLGILPYDEWEAFNELFPAESSTRGGGPAAGASRPSDRAARAPGNPAPAPAQVGAQ